jgi:hypothetical protein
MNDEATMQPADAGRLDPGVGRPVPERAALLAQIEQCRREVASWPEWMRATRTAPKWMEGWDD